MRKIRHVVTCFLLHPDEGRVLLGQRSDKVSTYQTRWAAISGSVETSPFEQALTEIQEETGLWAEEVEVLATGLPVRFTDWQLDTRWIVHPFLFKCLKPGTVRLDMEHIRFRWVAPDNIGELDTVPRLTEAYDTALEAYRSGGHESKGEIFRRIVDDRNHGAEELGLWTVEGLRAALDTSARNCETSDQLVFEMGRACAEALDLRPSMSPPVTAALQVFGEVVQVDLGSAPAEVAADRLRQAMDEIISCREEAAILAGEKVAAVLPEGAHVLTLSLSSTVLNSLKDAETKIEKLTVGESRPACEGRKTAETAASFGIETELVTDAFAATAASEADVVLLGADSILSGGGFVNKTGSFALCVAAGYGGVPVVVAATQSKTLPEGYEPRIEGMDPHELGESIAGVRMRNPYFERVPNELISSIVSEKGEMSVESLSNRTTELRHTLERLRECFGNERERSL